MVNNRLAINNQQSIKDTTELTMRESAEVAPQVTNSLEERVETTEFCDDLGMLAQPMPGEVPMPSRDTEQHTDAHLHSIISFLGRPVVLKSLTVDSSSVQDDTIASFAIPNDFLLASNNMFLNKLDGFTSFRATAVIKMQINSQPFQAGRLLMVSIPMPPLIGNQRLWVTKTVSQAQQLHHVQIDVNKQTEVELRIPFISPFNSYDLINGKFQWSSVKVMVYSPLNQVSNPPLECLFWGHFEDVVLGAPTSGPVIGFNPSIAQQQSGRVQQVKIANPAPKQANAQQANAKRAVESTGAITKISNGAQGFWNGIGNTIPAVKPVTDVLSGLAGAVGAGVNGIFSGLGSLIGFSKPTLSHAGSTVVVRPSQYFGNANGTDHSHVMALDVLNSIDEYPGLLGTNMSETSLEYLSRIPQFIGSFCYGKGSKYGQELETWFVTPMNFIAGSSVLQYENLYDYVNEQPTVLAYLAGMFEYWTGSLVYTLRFVKTDYHSGRVEISFHPFVYNTVKKDRINYTYRLVVDLRENSEVSFVVPYVSPQPWKSTREVRRTIQNKEADIESSPHWYSTSIGKIHVRALTPLICANDVIANNIQCLVEVRAGEDFRLQCPTKNMFIPFSIPTLPRVPTQQSGGVYALPGTQETRTGSIEGFLPPSITGSLQDIQRPDTQRYCAGEEFSDFIQLTRRFGFVERISTETDSSGTKLTNRVQVRDARSYLRCPQISYVDWGSTFKGGISWSQLPSPLSMISSLYAFYRGSFRIKVFVKGGTGLITAQLYSTGQIGDTGTSARYSPNVVGPCAYEQIEEKKFAEFQVPYYSPTMVSAHWSDDAQFGSDTVLYSNPQTKVVFSNTDDAATYHVAAAAGDDFTLHTFIGIPPVFLNSMFGNPVDNTDGAPSLMYGSKDQQTDSSKGIQWINPGLPLTVPWPPPSDSSSTIKPITTFPIKIATLNPKCDPTS